MLSVDIGQANARLLTCSAVLVGGTVLSGATAGIAGAVAGTAASVLATDLHNFLVNRISQSAEVLRNHDLTKAVGAAISVVIEAVAEAKVFPEYKTALQKLAKTAVDYWPTVARATEGRNDPFVAIKENQLTAIYFASSAIDFEKVKALEPEIWEEVLDWLVNKAGVYPPKDIIEYLAKALHTTFPKALREVLKEDAEKGGKAFAGLLMSLMGDIVAAIGQLKTDLKIQHGDIVNRLESLATSMPDPQKTAQKLCDLLLKVESGLSSSLHEIGLANRRIEALLLRMAAQLNDVQANLNDLKQPLSSKNSEPSLPSKSKKAFVISGTLNDDNGITLKAILAHLQKISGDASLTIIDVKDGSIILFLEGSQEGLDRLEALFKSGNLKEVLGVTVENVHSVPSEAIKSVTSPKMLVNLNQWLHNNFIEAIEAGWQTLEEIFSPRELAFRSGIKRAKQIDLGAGQIVVLVFEVSEVEDREIKVLLRLYPMGEQIYLPESLTLTVIPESGEALSISSGIQDGYLEQEWFYLPGEEFSVTVTLGNVSVTEYFAI